MLIENERLMRTHGLIDGVWSRLWHRLSGAVVGYGYRPSLALVWLAGFLVLGAAWFDAAYEDGAMVPNDTRVLLSDGWTACETLRAFGGGREKDETVTACWLRSGKGIDYQRFQPLTYAADAFLPIVNLHQEPAWIPQPERATHWLTRQSRIFLWLYIAIGWALTALAVAGFTGLVKRD